MSGSVSQKNVSALYIGGMSSPEIAEATGFSAVHVRRILKKEGVQIRSLSAAMKISHNRPEMREKFVKASTGRKHSEAAKNKLRARSGPLNANWRNGLTLGPNGYLCFTASPNNGAHASRSVHRVIAEWKFGRALTSKEHVHHNDGNKLNNHPDNLEVMSASDHARHHAIDSKLGKSRNA